MLVADDLQCVADSEVRMARKLTRRAASLRSRTAGPTQRAAAWTALAQGIPQRGQGLGWTGRPPRKLFLAAAIARATRRVSLRAMGTSRSEGHW